ncbi:DUF2975 domain-containing protein [Escherichia coli]|uniref:DUF2975 domain-containing protein n=1 Tax=Escherichia coli TaxID=562 RepID=UPI00208DC7B7|nr:DUF2975 domain-containing protein [Escherichia coli]
MADIKLTEELLQQVLESTIQKLETSTTVSCLEQDMGEDLYSPNIEPDETKEVQEPTSAKEQAAFETPSQEDTDNIQYLELASMRFRLQREEIETGKLREQVEGLKAQNRNHNAIARGRKIDNRLRLQMAKATFQFMQYWCSFVAFMVFMYFCVKKGELDPNVVIALLGTSTISIVGLVGFVVSGLFKSDNGKEKKE